jgi:hypothetical protein
MFSFINVSVYIWLKTLYNVWPLMDANCSVLGYRGHHSICYTRLFTTPLVVIRISGYNEFRPSDVLSQSCQTLYNVIRSSWLKWWGIMFLFDMEDIRGNTPQEMGIVLRCSHNFNCTPHPPTISLSSRIKSVARAARANLHPPLSSKWLFCSCVTVLEGSALGEIIKFRRCHSTETTGLMLFACRTGITAIHF